MMLRSYGLPCAWHYLPERDVTVRWGRPDPVFTVHRGDRRGERGDHALIDTVAVTQPWIDDNDVARKARHWARNHHRSREPG
ncbi:hypothetical protein [Saccharopolyspora gregorii]|uniref:hypothetical protein n=1 Tax=Saccharopolyspora gregorii TaxID=33914 RepID=UPI0021AC7E33|nr:hypothetical protein [Saccharopolyspora gregorii]